MHNSLKLSFTNIWVVGSNFADCESFLESNSPDILALYETNLDDSIDSGSFSVNGYLLLIWKDSTTHMHGLTVYLKEGLPFAQDISLSILTYVFIVYFFFLYWSLSLCLHMVFDSISSNIDEVLSINLSTNVFVFGDFSIHHKDWITYSGGTNRHDELCYNFSISRQSYFNFPTQIPDCDSHSPAFLDFFLSSDNSIVLQCLSLHWETLIMLLSQFQLAFHQIHNMVPFHCIAYDYTWAYWVSLWSHLRDVPWEDIYKLSSSAAASKFLMGSGWNWCIYPSSQVLG